MRRDIFVRLASGLETTPAQLTTTLMRRKPRKSLAYPCPGIPFADKLPQRIKLLLLLFQYALLCQRRILLSLQLLFLFGD
jgi:hypothetical protein